MRQMIESGRDRGRALDLVIDIIVQITSIERSSRRRSEHERSSSARPAGVCAYVAVVFIEEIVSLADAILLDILVPLIDLRPPQAISEIIVYPAGVQRGVRRRIVALRLSRSEFALLTTIIDKATKERAFD